MSDHLIRFRKGWGVRGSTGDAGPRPFALPCDGPPAAAAAAAAAAVLLTRWFRRPPVDPACETLWLRLDAVPGLASVALNGRTLAEAPFASPPPYLIPLGDGLPARNLLALTVDAPGDGDPAPASASPWGDVALLVRGPDPP